MKLKKGLSVVIPVYNSQDILPNLLAEIARVLPTAADEFEVVLVNDGSRDNSWQVIREVSQRYAWLRAINLMRNYGQHNALLCGIRASQYEIIVTMDDDLQHPPQDIPKLLAELEKGFDIVYGTPVHEQHGLWRDLASKAIKFTLMKVMGVEVSRQISAFRVFRTQLRDSFANFQGAFLTIDVLLTWGSTRFSSVKVSHNPRQFGKSNYSSWKLFQHALNLIVGFSVLPLQIASIIGFFFTLFGLGVLAFVLIKVLLDGSGVPGFPFLASIISIFSGAQLFALGIIGEYLARMHFRMMERPAYTVRETITIDEKKY